MRLVAFALVVLAATEVPAGTDPSILKSSTMSIALVTHGPNGTRQTVDLVKGDVLDVDAAKILHGRHLDADELAALRKAWAAVPDRPAPKPSDGPPPDGSGTPWQYEVRDLSGAITLVAFTNGAPAGSRYVAIDADTAETLSDVWPSVVGKKVRDEAREVRVFLAEAIFGRPSGPRDIEKSFSRLDPTGKAYRLIDQTRPGEAIAIQLSPAHATPLKAADLARELEVAHPVAFLVNGVWKLGDSLVGKPLHAWRGAELSVVVGIPAGVIGPVTAIVDAPVEGIVLRRQRD